MDADEVEKIAAAVLYEGYLLFPYRRSAVKNQQRWTFGGVYPRGYSEAGGGHDPWLMQTQCLVAGAAGTRLEVKVRFLHVVDRLMGQVQAGRDAPSNAVDASDELDYVEALRVGEQVYRPWEEAIERDIVLADLRLDDLIERSRHIAIDVPAGRSHEPLADAEGTVVGALVRAWRPLQGTVEITAELLEQDGGNASAYGSLAKDPAASGIPPLFRLTVRITNTTPWPQGETAGQGRSDAVRQTLVSTHTILRVQDGEFVSLLEPPPALERDAEACVNIKTWPVLVGDDGERHTLLSSPIILYDYPRVSPESPGDLFDATEIDELLRLSIMTLTDEEKQEMRASDARAREILERTESLSQDHLMKLHAAVRSLEPSRGEGR